MPFDRTRVTISLSRTVVEILALISKNFKRSRDPECNPYPTLRNFDIYNGNTFYVQSATKLEMSSLIWFKDVAWTPKCRNVSRDPDHAPFRDDLSSAS